MDADFVIFDPDATWQVDDARLHYKVGVSPYQGMTATGQVESTWLRGSCVFENDLVTGAAGGGQFVRPE